MFALKTFRFASPVVALIVFGCGGTKERARDSSSSESSHTSTMEFDVTPTSDIGPTKGVDLQGDDDGLQILREAEALGTRVKIVAFTNKKVGIDAVEVALDNALAELEHLDGVLNDNADSSDVSRINKSAGSWISINPSTTEVVSRAIWCGEISQGACDITTRTLSPLWNFDPAERETPSLPEASALGRARSKVGYRSIQLNESSNKVQIGAGQKIGLSRLSSGYAIDKMAGILTRAGVTSFLIKVASTHFASGAQPGGTPWIVEVQDPRLPKGASFASMTLKNAAFSTVGDYRSSFLIGKERYHPLLDPDTGYPAKASRSVSIWAPTALMADALDDAVFVLGPAQGLSLVGSLDGVGAVIVDAENKLWVSEGLKAELKVDRQPTDKP